MEIKKIKSGLCENCGRIKEEVYLFKNAQELGIKKKVTAKCWDCIKKKYPKAREYIEKYKEIKARKEKLKEELERKKKILKILEEVFKNKTIELESGISLCEGNFNSEYNDYEIDIFDLIRELRHQLNEDEKKIFCFLLLGGENESKT